MIHTVDNSRFVQILQFIFRAQARDVMSKLSIEKIEAGEVPDLTHWIAETAKTIKPIYLQWWQYGTILSQRRRGELKRGLKPDRGMRRRVVPTSAIFGVGTQKAPPRRSTGATSRILGPPSVATRSPAVVAGPSRVSSQFDLFTPKIIDAVDEATMKFCRETNETAVKDLNQAIADLRKLLKKGLKRGDAVSYLAKQVGRIFADPSRAFRIATTETSRAMHGGALLSAKADPDVGGKQWLASPDACDACLELDGLEKKLDEPFWVDRKGGPYAIVMYPPLHPHCFCDMTETLA